MEVKIRKVFRSGNVIGMPVKTPEHKKIGNIEETVIDIQTGQVAYAVLSFGGFFGFGNKFFAVPWEEFSFIHDEKENYFIVDTSKEKLNELPGFDKEVWPDVANSDWDALVDAHYQVEDDDDEDDEDDEYFDDDDDEESEEEADEYEAQNESESTANVDQTDDGKRDLSC